MLKMILMTRFINAEYFQKLSTYTIELQLIMCMCVHGLYTLSVAHMLEMKSVMSSGGTWSNTGFCTCTLDTSSP